MTGADVQDRFVIERQLGAGAAGTVYAALDTARGTTVAVKVLHQVDPASLLRFKTEFRALTNLSHPNLLQLFELVQVDEDLLLCMELIDGDDFFSFVRSRGAVEQVVDLDEETELGAALRTNVSSMPPANDNRRSYQLAQLDEDKLRTGLRQLAEGLSALHRSDRLHRDLKPANVLVSRSDQRVVICDFGLVIDRTAHLHRSTAPTQSDDVHVSLAGSEAGEIAGTLAFMSPEQAAGLELTPASDWYAVGAILYQALTLQVPFSTRVSWAEAVRMKREERPLHPLAIASDLPLDLAELAMALLHPDPSQRAGAAEVLAALAGKLEGAPVVASMSELLVGRERELVQLQTAFARVRIGQAGVALLSGKSGMGKSAVAARFLADGEKAGARVLRARCYECEDLPYKAFDPLMDALSGLLLSLPDTALEAYLTPDVRALSELFPVLGRVPAIARAPAAAALVDPFERKRRALRACRQLFHALGQSGPLILYVDDLQWGDLDSGPLFAELLRGEDAPALFVLFAFRAEDELTSPLIRALRQDLLPNSGVQNMTELCVGALQPEDAERLASVLLAGTGLSANAVPAVVREAGGSPFFIRELACHVRAHGTDHERGLKLETVLDSRIAALPEHSRTLLEFVAVAGRPEAHALIHRASGLGHQAFAAGQTLKAHNFVQSAGSHAEARIEAYHDRIRETVYASLSDDRRRSVHRSLAVALEASTERALVASDAEALLEHWRKAGDPQRALRYAIFAAEKADTALAFLHAAKLYRSAIALIENDPRRVSELEGKSGQASMSAGHGVEAADAFFRAMVGATDEGAQDFRRLAITQLLKAGQLRRAFAELSKAKDVLGLGFPRSTFQAIAMLLGRRVRTRLNESALVKRAQQGVPAQTSQQVDNLHRVSMALTAVDFLRGGVYTAEHTLRALAHGHPYHVAAALSIETVRSAGTNKNPAQTQWLIDKGLEIANQLSDPYPLAACTGTTGLGRYLEGRFEEAVTFTRESQHIHREQLHSVMSWDLVTMAFFEMQALSQLGRVGEMVARVPAVLRDAEDRGDLYGSTLLRVGRCSWAWLAIDQPELAQKQRETAQRQWLQDPYQLVHYYMLQASGEIALYQDRAEDVYERILREQKPMALVNKIQFTRVQNLYLLARVALEVARKTGDQSALRRAQQCAKAMQKESATWGQLMGRLVAACAASVTAPASALGLLAPLALEFSRRQMTLTAAVVQYRIGQGQTSSEGRAGMAEARDAILRLGVKNPEAFVRVLAPGFPG